MFQNSPVPNDFVLQCQDFDFSDPFPNGPRALFLRHHLNQRLIQGLGHLLSTCRSVLPDVLVDDGLAAVQALNAEKPLSPFLFALQLTLLSSIQNQDVNAAGEIVKDIITLNPTTPELAFLNLPDLSPRLRDTVRTLINNGAPQPMDIWPAKKFYNDRVSDIKDALELLKTYVPTLYDELMAFQNTYLITGSDHMKAGSSFYMFGLIFLRENFVTTVIEMVDLIVHEAGHLYLYALQSDDALILNSPDERYQAPLRADKRPLVGIFHAVFVLSRVLYTFDNLLKKGAPLTDSNRNEAIKRREFYKNRCDLSIKLLQEKAKFTPLGRTLLDKTEAMMAADLV